MDMGLKTLQERESRLALYMLAPALVIVLLLVFFPTAWNIWLSLKPVSLEGLRGEGLWNAGLTLRNYQKVLSDPELPGVAATTLAYTVGGSLFSILLGLTAALLVHKEFPGRAFIRGLLISPYIAPIVAVAFTWSFILDPQLGCLNWLGVKTGVLDQPVAFFSARWIQVRPSSFSRDGGISPLRCSSSWRGFKRSPKTSTGRRRWTGRVPSSDFFISLCLSSAACWPRCSFSGSSGP